MTAPESRLVVDIRGLTVRLDRTSAEVVSDVSLRLHAGQVTALVGESGSGKTTVGSAMLGYCRPGAGLAAGEIIVAGHDVGRLSGEALRSVRGSVVSYVPQDPATALNPIRRIGSQLRESVLVHQRGLESSTLNDEIQRVLEEVKLPADRAFLRRFPHQLSGGQQQRLILAMAFVLRPQAIVLDEPTTGLDVTTQAHVLQTVRDLCASHGVAALYVTHDLAVVRGLADTVVVLYAGRVVESGPAAEVFAEPKHPYTRGLLAAIPDLDARRALNPIEGHAPPPGVRTEACSFAPRCDHSDQECLTALPELRTVSAGRQARCARLELIPAALPLALQSPAPMESSQDPQALFRVAGVHCAYGAAQVVRNVSFAVGAGRCLALVGESGSGKSTLSKAFVGLVQPTKGEIWLGDALLPAAARKRPAEVRRQVQYVFQNPYRSLNPRLTIRQSLSVPVRQFFGASGEATRRLVDEALDRVALPRRLAAARPRDLSGGERQRAAIARALLCKPAVLICDEVTSALDVSVQAAIIRLLDELRAADDLAMVFVTHNLAVVRAIADDVVVLRDGQVVEAGSADAVLDHPTQAYTRSLLADTPRLGLAEASAERTDRQAFSSSARQFQMEDDPR